MSAIDTKSRTRLLTGIRTFRDNAFPDTQSAYERVVREGQKAHALFLTCAEYRVGPELLTQSRPVRSSSATQSALCGYFALILLAGLFANQHFGFGRADSTASLIMSPLIVRERKRALEGQALQPLLLTAAPTPQWRTRFASRYHAECC